MKHLFSLAILSCLALAGCQQEAPVAENPAAPKPAAPKPAVRKTPPMMTDNPFLTDGLTAEQVRKMEESKAHFADISLGKPIEIMAQTDHKIEGTDLVVAFTQIKRDSRCPTGAQCVWKGEVKVEVTVRKGAGKPQKMELGEKPVDWNGYRLTMQDVLPHPSTDKPQASLPRLLLLVDKAQGKAQVQAVPGTEPTDDAELLQNTDTVAKKTWSQAKQPVPDSSVVGKTDEPTVKEGLPPPKQSEPAGVDAKPAPVSDKP